MFGFFSKRKRARLLIVDDEPSIIDPLKERLETSGYEVVTASNGQQGLIRAVKYVPQLIILDTNMPYMDGPEMLERLRENPDLRHTAVIMLTACRTIENLDRTDKLRVEDYVTKPFDTHDLITRIEKVLIKNGILEPAY